MNFPGMDEDKDARTAAALDRRPVVDYSMTRLANGDFYILCPDNEVTPLMDKNAFAGRVKISPKIARRSRAGTPNGKRSSPPLDG